MKKVASVLIFLFLICGCSNENQNINKVMDLRETINAATECTFTADITADYQSETYTFQMSCKTNQARNVQFAMIAPDSIAGITGTVSDDGGKLTFDDKYLVFAPLVDGQITPVSSPWIFIKTLRSGYISGCTDDNDGSTVVFTDSYQNNTIEVSVIFDSNLIPTSAEIFWQGRRVVTLIVENFTIV